MPRFRSDLLRTVRLDLDLTQEAAAAALGIDVRTFRRYESGAVNDGEAFTVRQPARRKLLRRMCEEFGVADERDWLTEDPAPEASPEVLRGHWIPRLAHPLQRARHFLGREDLLRTLTDWHTGDAPEPRAVALVAVGGTGKTALVERFLATHGRSARGGVFAWSFYDDARTEALLGQAAEYFAGEQADGGGAEGPRLDRLLVALRGGPRHLLVLDGLETVQSTGGDGRAFGEIDDPAVRRLVRALAAGLGDARLLVTSRFPVSDLAPWEGTAARTVPLGELSRPEALALLRAWGLRGDDTALAPLFDRVGGHALSVAMLGSYAGAFLGGDPGRVEPVAPRDVRSDDALARRLTGVLDAYAGALADRERDLLARLAVLPGGGDPALLAGLCAAGGDLAGALAGCDERAIAKILARLDRLGLVSRGEGPRDARVTAHPFVREHFKALLGVPAERLHEALRGVVGEGLRLRPGGRVADADVLDRIEALLEHTLLAGRPVEALGVYERGLGGFGNLGLRLGAMARGARVMRLFSRQGAPEAMRAGLSPGVRADVLYDWGLYAGAQGDLALARRCHEAHLATAAEEPQAEVAAARRAMGLRTLAYVLWLAGDLDRAAGCLAASLAAAAALDNVWHRVRGHALLAVVERDRGHADAAERHLAATRDLDPGVPVARRALWEAEVRLAQGRVDEARALALGSLAFCADRGWPGHVAHARVVLGEATAATDPARAAELLEEARPWVGLSGEVEMALRLQQLAARLALGAGRVTDALAAADAGRELAAGGGFALFEVRLGRLAAAAHRAAGHPEAARAEDARARARAAACGYVTGP